MVTSPPTLVEQTDAFGWGDKARQGFEHLRQRCAATPTETGLLILLCREQSQQLAEVFLMYAADNTLAVGNPVIAADKKIVPCSCSAHCHFANVQAAEPCEDHAERFIGYAPRKTLDVGLQDVGRRGTVKRDADPTLVIDVDGELVLDACKRHRDALLTDQEWPLRQFIDDALKCWLVIDDAEIISLPSRLTDREGTCRIAADTQQETDYVLGRDLELLANFGEMGFRQQVREPRHDPFGPIAARAHWHCKRQWEG